MKKITTLLLSLCALSLVAFSPAATKKSSGSKPSWSQSSSKKKSTPARSPATSKPSSWSKKPATSTAPKKAVTSSSVTKKTTTPTKAKAAPVKRTAAQEAAYKKASQNGKAFKSKEAASADFKKTNAAKYKTTYTTKPATRPEHIPQSYSSGGRSYDVVYDSRYGGYGYMGPSGSWVVYDAMRDAAMVSLLMNRQGYYYDSQPRVVHQSSGNGLVVFLIAIGCAICIGGVVVVIVTRK